MLRFISKASTEEPIDLKYFLGHTRGWVGADDDDAGRKMVTAIRDIERETGRDSLLEATFELTLARWPQCGEYIALLAQTSIISSITYEKADGTSGTMPAGDYRLVGGYTPGESPLYVSGNQVTGVARVQLRYGKSWPGETLETGEPIAVRFVAGWKLPAHVPEDLKIGICLLGADLGLNREATITASTGISQASLVGSVDHSIRPYREATRPGLQVVAR